MRSFAPEPVDQEPARVCDHPGCEDDGIHRAPRDRDTLTSYYWFCLEHVRSYNSSWNFFGDMGQQEIEDYLHEDFTWHRPTWPLGGGLRAGRISRDDAINDPYGVFGAAGGEAEGSADEVPRRSPVGERDALAVLNLSPDATAGEIRTRYKELVKRLHPDANGGDRKAEDQLKTVIEAYRLLSGRQVAQ